MWDISAEIVILYDYLKKFPDMIYTDIPSMMEKIKKFSYDISRHITKTHRTLLTEMIDPTKRRNFGPKDHTDFYPELAQYEKEEGRIE